MAQTDSTVTKVETDLLNSSKKISNKQGHWNQQEHKAYIAFLRENTNHTKGQRLFKKMSQIVGTRTPSQCRSHHQKFNPLKIKQTKDSIFLKSKQMARKYFANHKSSEDDNKQS